MPEVAQHVKQAVDFLRAFPGRHSLTAIDPDTREIESALFGSADDPALASWVAAREGTRNLYWTVNEPAEHARSGSKLKKAEIGRVRAFHVELDPAPGQPLEAERARLRGVVGALPGNPALVDTGGGFAAFYPVAYPVQHDEVERVNRALAYAHGGDRSAWNVDRIMRLPGTTNLPDARKKARGRVAARSAVLRPPGPMAKPEDFAHLPAPALQETDRAAEAEAVRAAAETIGAAAWEPGDWLLIPAEARERLEGALTAHPRLAQLWRGQALQDGHDGSRSGLRFTLARECRQLRLSAVEYAHLVQCSPALRFADDEMGDALRQLSRAWARHDPALDPAAWFAPVAPTAQDIWDLVPREAEERQALAWIDPSEIPDDFEPPVREWEVVNWLPAREVTSFYGAGGTGKTLNSHILAVCLAAGIPWMGQTTRRGVVLGFFGEDSDDELKRRHVDIMRAHGLRNGDLGGRFRFVSRRAMDNRLATFGKDGGLVLTPLWYEIRDACLAMAERYPDCGRTVILDTLADIYAGSEIDRQQVNAFVKQGLLRLAIETGFAVLPLAHPSAAGESSGSGYSGSTHWNAAVRSRWYLRFPDKSANPNVRLLEVMKNNYGPPSGKLQIEYGAGVFRLLAGTTSAAEAARVPTLTHACEAAVVAALASVAPFQASMSPQGNYAPKILRTKDRALSRFSTEDIAAAMERLLARGLLQHAEIARDKARRPVMGYRVAELDGVFD